MIPQPVRLADLQFWQRDIATLAGLSLIAILIVLLAPAVASSSAWGTRRAPAPGAGRLSADRGEERLDAARRADPICRRHPVSPGGARRPLLRAGQLERLLPRPPNQPAHRRIDKHDHHVQDRNAEYRRRDPAPRSSRRWPPQSASCSSDSTASTATSWPWWSLAIRLT